jgi:uncharacterized membrane protein
MIKKIVFALTFLIFSVMQLNAQQDIDMADTFRENGKIYVVVGILSIVFSGIIIFLIRLEKKVARLEKEQN